MDRKVKKLLDKANSFYVKKDFKSAAIVLGDLVVLDDSNPDYFEKLGMAYYHLNDLKECLNKLNQAQKLDPNNSFRYSSRAYVRNGIGDVEGAIKDYETAIHLDPEDAIAHNNLGLLQEKKGFEKQAKSNFDKADSLAHDFFKNDTVAESNSGINEIASVEIEGAEGEMEETRLKTIRKVFQSKQGFDEFLSFIKNGFKLK